MERKTTNISKKIDLNPKWTRKNCYHENLLDYDIRITLTERDCTLKNYTNNYTIAGNFNYMVSSDCY